MAEVARELTSNGHSVNILFRSREQPDAVRYLFEGSGASVHLAPTWKKYARKVHQYTESRTLLLTFGLKQSLIGRVMKIVRRKQLLHVMARNGLDYEWPEPYFAFDRMTQSLVDTYLCNSHSVQRHLERRGIRTSALRVLVSALDPQWFLYGVTGEPGRREDIGSIVMVGNARPEKNQALAIRSLRTIQMNYALQIYTDSADALKSQIDLLPRNCEVSVREGTIVEPKHYDAADILLHPSTSESLPRAVLEASARGCYVIALDTGDTSDIVDRARSSILPVDADPKQIAQSVEQALRNVSVLRNTRTIRRAGMDTSEYAVAIANLLTL